MDRNWEGSWPGQLSRAGQRGIPCHMRMSCSVYKLKVARSHCWVLGGRLGISWWVVSNFIVYDCWLVHFSYIDFYFSLLSVISIFITIITSCINIIFHFMSIIKLFLSQPPDFTFFPFSSLSRCRVGGAVSLGGT